MTMPTKMKMLEETILMPRITLSLAAKNLRSGKGSGRKSVSFSAQFTLLRLLFVLAGLCLAVKTVLCMMKMKMRSQERRRYKEKLKRKKNGRRNRVFRKKI